MQVEEVGAGRGAAHVAAVAAVLGRHAQRVVQVDVAVDEAARMQPLARPADSRCNVRGGGGGEAGVLALGEGVASARVKVGWAAHGACAAQQLDRHAEGRRLPCRQSTHQVRAATRELPHLPLIPRVSIRGAEVVPDLDGHGLAAPRAVAHHRPGATAQLLAHRHLAPICQRLDAIARRDPSERRLHEPLGVRATSEATPREARAAACSAKVAPHRARRLAGPRATDPRARAREVKYLWRQLLGAVLT